jgi:hypothetical protein
VESVGARRYLQPLLYVGVAIGVHSLLLLIPYRLGTGTPLETTRGVRIRAVKETPPDALRATPAQTDRAQVPKTAQIPQSIADKPYSSLGGETAGQAVAGTGTPGGGSGGQGQAGTGQDGAAEESAFGSYLARLRSDGVQGWARDSAGLAKQGWKGSGKAGSSWGSGAGGGSGTGDDSGRGTGRGDGGGGGYLDPRVRMVVTSYPPTAIETGYTHVPYPDLKVKQHQAITGWWNVYIQIVTDRAGRIVKRTVLRPESDGPVERMFVAQVQREIDRWVFERAEAEILVDVRFHVE